MYVPRYERRAQPLTWLAGLIITLVAAGPAPVHAAVADKELLDLSIEELLHVEITSASKKSQLVSETAAAVFVITQDDIRRSGARNIPEALRLAPGIQVAQIDANKWAVSARGFNGRFSNKLLVLMDGRALFTPSFAGVFWDAQDTIMEDIERIEIIRGPGGTLWGVNAVNGVINIITRPSQETQGGALVVNGSQGPTWTGHIRYGDTIGSNASYRVYAKYLDEAGNEDMAGVSTNDGWHIGRVGLRTDWTPSDRDAFSLTAEGYGGRDGETLNRPLLTAPYSVVTNAKEDIFGVFTVARWVRHFAERQELQAQVYFDRTGRDTLLFGEDRNTVVAEIQYRFPLGTRHDIVSGAGFRQNSYIFKTTNDVNVTPHSPTDTGFNGFVQDEVHLIDDRLSLTLGVDLEHNPLAERNVEALPSGRLMWSVNEKNHLWTAVTKAISTPSYEQTGASVRNASPIVPPGDPQNPFPVPIVTTVVGNRDIRSEKLIAYEIGYRTQLGSAVTIDTTLFRHDYSDVRGEATTNVYCAPSQVPVALDPLCVLGANAVVNQLQFQNGIRGHSSGVELAADWVPSSRFRARASYTYLDLQLEADLPLPEIAYIATMDQGQSPRQQFSLRGDLSLTHALDLDASVRYVDALPASGIDKYWSADANLIWRAGHDLEVSVTGRNLLKSSHLEFISELSDVVPTRIERSIGAGFRWTF